MTTTFKSVMTVLLALFSLSAYAYDVEIDGIYYDLDRSNMTASVTSGDTKYSGAVSIPETCTYKQKTYRVTSIGDDAFLFCSSLTTVSIPSSVTSIGEYAFSNCSGLTSVSIPSSVTSIGDRAFSVCSGLNSVSIPNSVTYIGPEAFFNCSSLTAISIPSSVTSISKYTFFGCSSLKSVSIPNSVTSIGEYAFSGCSGLTSVSIPSSVTSIGSSAFYYCIGLKSVSIPSSVTSIGKYTFYGCSSLKSVSIPNSVTTIGEYAFSGCSGLTAVSIPNSVTSIGDGAFQSCSGLSSVSIPNSVTYIGKYTFYGCSSLKSVSIPNSVTSIGSSAFMECIGLKAVYIKDLAAWCRISCGYNGNPLLYAHHLYLNGEEVKDLVIPNSVTSIGDGAFQSCSGLSSVSIPNSVTSIGEYAFSGCSGLTSVSIPSSVTSIAQSTFSNCHSLKSVSIPNSVTSIGSNAFNFCNELTSVSIPNSVTSIGYSAFRECYQLTSVVSEIKVPFVFGSSAFSSISSSCTLTVPYGTKDAYIAAGWTENVFKGGIIEVPNPGAVSISSAGIATFCCSSNLDFSGTNDVKAYVVSAFRPTTGEVTLTRVYEVPAGTGLVLIGKQGEYAIPPLSTNEMMAPNLLVGVNENTALKATENGRTNFILPEDQGDAAFCAVTDEVELPFGKAYLPLPTESIAHLEDGKLTLHLADPSLGDVNGDGYVNISDVTTLVNIILGK